MEVMKLASFIILSTALHGAVLVYPIFFAGSEREQLLPATIISGDEEGGGRDKSTAVGNKGQGSARRATPTENTLDRKVTELAKIGAPNNATPSAEESANISVRLSIPPPSDSYGIGASAPGGAGGSENGAGGTGHSGTGSGIGSGKGPANGTGLYIQARTSDAPKPKYPDAARRDGKEGRVLLRVLVNEEGRTASVEVNRSSGAEALDQAAVETIKHWRFSPARLGDRPVESWVRIPIDFRLTDTRD